MTTETIASNSSATTTPFQSVFLSTTRPIPTSSSSTSSYYTPYTILFQHSTKLNQRITASTPSSTSSKQQQQQQQQQQQHQKSQTIDEETNFIYQNAGIQTPKEMSIHNNTGSLFIMEAWRECVRRCFGQVIVIQTCSNSYLDVGGNNGGAGSGAGSGNVGGSGSSGIRGRKYKKEHDLFLQHGVVIDLYSDPLGWDDSDDDDNDNDVNANDDQQPTIFKGQTNKLQSLLDCIQKAAIHISKQSDVNNNNNSNSNSNRKNSNSKNQQCQCQPIPIIFDSITPLLIHHGVHPFTMFLSLLKKQQIHDNNNNNNSENKSSSSNNNNNNNNNIITSPIFLPTIMEYLPPNQNQTLEDYADTLLSLYNGQLHIAKRSVRRITTTTNTTINNTTINNRNGNATNGGGGMVYPGFSGGIRLVKDVQLFELNRNTKELILFNSMNSSKKNKNKTNNTTNKDGGGGGDDDDKNNATNDSSQGEMMTGMGNMGIGATTNRNSTSGSTSSNRNKKSIQLQHEHDHGHDHDHNHNHNGREEMSSATVAATSNKPTPRIYIEDNDPEYADLDEEDPDDDLDI